MNTQNDYSSKLFLKNKCLTNIYLTLAMHLQLQLRMTLLDISGKAFCEQPSQ